MSRPENETVEATDAPRSSRAGRLALLLAVLAIAATLAQWFGINGRDASDRVRNDELARTQRRLSALEDRIQREHDDLIRLTQKIGTEGQPEDSVTGRIERLEDAMAKQPGGEKLRFIWLLEQAEYYMRIANAQESLAGDSASALTALMIADQHLANAGGPRLTAVRKLVATEIATLRALPSVDTEGLVLKLGTLAQALDGLPRRQRVPDSFRVQSAAPPASASGWDRAVQSMRSAFSSIVSVRRTDAPIAPLMSDESVNLLIGSLELELQMARLVLLRGEAPVYKASLANVRRVLEQNFDTRAAAGAGALATLKELAAAPLPESLPDISASLAELLRIKERELKP